MTTSGSIWLFVVRAMARKETETLCKRKYDLCFCCRWAVVSGCLMSLVLIFLMQRGQRMCGAHVSAHFQNVLFCNLRAENNCIHTKHWIKQWPKLKIERHARLELRDHFQVLSSYQQFT